MFKHVTYIMVNVSDMSRSVAFYRDKLGMTLKYQTDYWTEFETGTTILALHLADRPARDGKKATAQQLPELVRLASALTTLSKHIRNCRPKA